MNKNKTIKINDKEYIELSEYKTLEKQKVKVINAKPLPFEIDGKYFIRTVTYFATGRVVAIHGDFLELEEAAWVADTGRFSTALSTGVLNEVEPTGTMFLNVTSIVDAHPWKFDLPNVLK